MAINKFQWSRLGFDHSAKIAHIGVQSIYSNIVFSETTGQIELKFHTETPKEAGTKACSNSSGHMTKMAATHIYGIKPLKIIISRSRREISLGLCT